MFRKFLAAVVLIFFVASINCPTVSAFKPGEVYRATGTGLPPKNVDSNESFAKTYARQAARMDALHILAENMGGVRVDSTTDMREGYRIRDYIKTSIIHTSKLFKLITNHARQIGEAKFTPIDDELRCEVTMEIVVPADWKE